MQCRTMIVLSIQRSFQRSFQIFSVGAYQHGAANTLSCLISRLCFSLLFREDSPSPLHKRSQIQIDTQFLRPSFNDQMPHLARPLKTELHSSEG
jgi:hypothetical protein